MCAASESLKADRDLMGRMVWNYIVELHSGWGV